MGNKKETIIEKCRNERENINKYCKCLFVYAGSIIVITIFVFVWLTANRPADHIKTCAVWMVEDKIVFCDGWDGRDLYSCVDGSNYRNVMNLIDLNCEVPKSDIDTKQERNQTMNKILKGELC